MIKLKEIKEGVVLLESDKRLKIVTAESLMVKDTRIKELEIALNKAKRKVRDLSKELEEYEEIKLREEKDKLLSLIEYMSREDKGIDEIWDAIKANYWVTKEGFTKDMAKDFINNYCQ